MYNKSHFAKKLIEASTWRLFVAQERSVTATALRKQKLCLEAGPCSGNSQPTNTPVDRKQEAKFRCRGKLTEVLVT